MPPTWLTAIAWISLAAGFLSAGAILYDIYGRWLRQSMRVMETVWPVTSLYLGPVGWFAYTRLGRPTVMPLAEPGEEEAPEWQGVFVSATHCGAGCTLGDVIGEWIAFGGSLTLAGAALWPEYILDFAIAYALGILFQYLAIKPMSDLTPRQALSRAIRADTQARDGPPDTAGCCSRVSPPWALGDRQPPKPGRAEPTPSAWRVKQQTEASGAHALSPGLTSPVS
jgi:hypothetical protein